jgi:pimeloyl-ACP methyl ester carboxylesterase
VGGSTTNPPSIARRVDGERGVAEEVAFLGGPERLFSCSHLPTGPSRDLGVVVCSPILCDFGANYRREVSLARRLAAAGVPVLRYHPRGTGHSDGARTDLTLDSLVADAAVVLDRARDQLGVDRLAVLATRFSALAAAEATRGTGTPLALWEPVTRPRAYLRAGLRARAVARLGSAGELEEPGDELARQGWLDVLGIPVGRGLYDTTADRTLAAALAGDDRPLLVVRFEDGNGDLDLGVDAEVRVCPCDESWWFIPDRSAPGEEAVAATADWFLGLPSVPAGGRGESRQSGDGGERPVFLPAATGDLLGVLTEPAGPANGLAAVFLRGAGWRPSSGPRRTQVAAARRLAAHGFHALRFSYHGIAESGGEADEIVRLDRPYVADTRAAIDWATGEGLRTVLVGNCFGARTALATAAEVPGAVAGLVLSVPPVHDFEVVRRLDRRPLGHFARRLRPRHVVAVLRDRTRRRALGRTGRGLATLAGQKVRPRRHEGPEWVSRRFLGHVEAVTERGIPMLFVFGEEDRYHEDFVRARDHELGRVLDRAGDRVTVAVVPGRVHGLTSVATQEATLDTIEGWVRATCG